MKDKNKSIKNEPLFRLLRYAMGIAKQPLAFTSDEWQHAFDDARKQAVLGVVWTGIEQLRGNERPPQPLLLKWYATTERIKQANTKLNYGAVSIVRHFSRHGFRSVVLKGQGLAQLYPCPELRMPGDVDLWVEGGRERVLSFVRKQYKNEEVRYIHVHYPFLEDVDVEVHFTPSWMNAPKANHSIQRFFEEKKNEQMSHHVSIMKGEAQLPVPTVAFNAVYVLVHIFRHLLGEGIGLRQVMDYYYVLQSLHTDEQQEVIEELQHLGLTKFCAAMMYVLQQVFDMDEKFLLLPCDEITGRFVLDEIMQAGNFGKYDKRLHRLKHETSLYRFVRSLRRNVRFIKYFPTETLCDPLFKLWHFFWQCVHSYR